MKLQQYATMRGYQTAHHLENQPLIDMFLSDPEHGDRIREEVKLKRLQFDTTSGLFEQVEQVCSKLECSKREFLEMAVRDAIEQAHKFFDAALNEAADPDLLDQFSHPVEG